MGKRGDRGKRGFRYVSLEIVCEVLQSRQTAPRRPVFRRGLITGREGGRHGRLHPYCHNHEEQHNYTIGIYHVQRTARMPCSLPHQGKGGDPETEGVLLQCTSLEPSPRCPLHAVVPGDQLAVFVRGRHFLQCAPLPQAARLPLHVGVYRHVVDLKIPHAPEVEVEVRRVERREPLADSDSLATVHFDECRAMVL